MAINPATLAPKTPITCRFFGLHRSLVTVFGRKTLVSLNPSSGTGAKACQFNSLKGRPFGESRMGLRRLGSDWFRVLAVSDGGSGGSSGLGGNSGGSSDGGAGDEWSLPGWYMNLLSQYPVLTKAVTSALLTFAGDLICQEWFSAVVANWKLWIPFQFLNFRFVPQQFQVLAANAIALVWNVILSFKAHREILQK